jgi:hypothetical protein
MYKLLQTAINHFNNGEDFCNSSFDLWRDNDTFIKEVIKKNGWAIKHASQRIKDDEKWIREAMKSDPTAFVHASEILRSKRDLAKFAVELDGTLIEYVVGELRQDKELALIAVKQSPENIFNTDLWLEKVNGKFEPIEGSTANPLKFIENLILKEKLQTSLNKNSVNKIKQLKI